MSGTIKTLSSTIAYEDRWLRVRNDRISRPSGALGSYTVVEKADFAVIAAIQDSAIHLVEQFRHPVSGRYWELPQGSWTSGGDTPPADMAARELKEETGLISGAIEEIGFIYTAYGYSNQGCHVFLATELTFAGQELEPEEEDLISKAFSLDEFQSMIRRGEIKDATTLAAYGLLMSDARL